MLCKWLAIIVNKMRSCIIDHILLNAEEVTFPFRPPVQNVSLNSKDLGGEVGRGRSLSSHQCPGGGFCSHWPLRWVGRQEHAAGTKATYAGVSLAMRGTVSTCSTHSSPRGFISALCTQPSFCESILTMLPRPRGLWFETP